MWRWERRVEKGEVGRVGEGESKGGGFKERRRENTRGGGGEKGRRRRRREGEKASRGEGGWEGECKAVSVINSLHLPRNFPVLAQKSCFLGTCSVLKKQNNWLLEQQQQQKLPEIVCVTNRIWQK